ncbi:hypothetical protein ACFLYG_04030 [Chloroflexota bacterium]
MENDKELRELKEYIINYVERHTTKPAIEAVEDNIFIHHKLANSLVTFNKSIDLLGPISYVPSPVQDLDNEDIEKLSCLTKEEELCEDDVAFICHLTAKTCSKKCLLPFIDNQMSWIAVSIICASYLSSIILMRSVFELLINIATTQSGGMSKRIDAIPYIELDEKKTIKKTWDELCSWSHPYEKWLRNMCPIYISYKPTLHHPVHFKNCVNLLERTIDIFLVVSKEHFGLDINDFHTKINKIPIDLTAFPLFRSRIQDGK